MFHYRKLTHDDYGDILDISKNIWDGNDYLPQIFHDWVDAPGVFMGVVDADTDKVVGVGKYSILHDGSGWLEGLRIHEDYRGRKLARALTLRALDLAKEDLAAGKINKIAFSTHISAVESVSLMKNLNFKVRQAYIIVFKEPANMNPSLTREDFEVKPWDISYEEFIDHPYLKKKGNILPLAFCFEKTTPALYEELKSQGCFITVNGFRGIYKFKGEAHFLPFDESLEAVEAFSDYYLLILKDSKCTMPPMTIADIEDTTFVEKLKAAGYTVLNNWENDYLYFVYEP